jgi:hypothetical protein
MEEEDLLFRTLFFFNLQTIQAPDNKINPNQAYQNAITTLLLLSHNKNSTPIFHQTFKASD